MFTLMGKKMITISRSKCVPIWTFENSYVNATVPKSHELAHTRFIQGSLSKIQGLLKTVFQFPNTKSVGKILIKVLEILLQKR